MLTVNIIGAGLAGLSAAITLARAGKACRLISLQPSERAQSVLAEGGFNGALDTMGEGDKPEFHRQDTMRAGCSLADEAAVDGLTRRAPDLIQSLYHLGVPFHSENGVIQLRSFGGQKKKRTAFAASSTGKVIMTALIDEARRYEAEGLIVRYSHHELEDLLIRDGVCTGCLLADTVSGDMLQADGTVLLACGGMNGMFPDMTTGTTANSGDAAALAFARGVRFSNLEMIQYHPTTFAIPGKRCLISEAARGEGGRLYILRGDKPWYFMEEKYPELGNLMPRDVVSREMCFLLQDPSCGNQVYLDLTGLPAAVWQKKLPDMRKEIRHYMGIDPAGVPVPVEPGIHYFMGGIDVDIHHRTNIRGLYAAGECCSQYHGANRLGGNSMLGAVYGGLTAAEDMLACGGAETDEGPACLHTLPDMAAEPAADPVFIRALRDAILPGLGIIRSESGMQAALQMAEALDRSSLNRRERNRLQLACAILRSALLRRESRGAHFRTDYPDRDDSLCRLTTARWEGDLYVSYKEN